MYQWAQFPAAAPLSLAIKVQVLGIRFAAQACRKLRRACQYMNISYFYDFDRRTSKQYSELRVRSSSSAHTGTRLPSRKGLRDGCQQNILWSVGHAPAARSTAGRVSCDAHGQISEEQRLAKAQLHGHEFRVIYASDFT